MARLTRLAIAGHPHHVLQRGNNRQPIFVDRQDRQAFLTVLATEAERTGVAIHAYVLLEDHFHLLATPPTEQALSLMMQGLGRRYVRLFNARHGRSGTLWEGRYRATVLEASRHLLAAMVFVDLHPVRAGLTAHAAEYPWSSHGHYAGQRTDAFLTAPDAVWRLGNTPFARESAYREQVEAGIDEDRVRALTQSVRQGWVLGDEPFVAELQRGQTRRLSLARRGRPPGSRTTR